MQLEELGYLVTDCEKKKEQHSGGKWTKEGRLGLCMFEYISSQLEVSTCLCPPSLVRHSPLQSFFFFFIVVGFLFNQCALIL